MSEMLYTIREDDTFMKGYAQILSDDGYFDTLGKMTCEQASEHLHAKGYEVVRYLPSHEACIEAARRRELHRKAKPMQPMTGFELFCQIWEVMDRCGEKWLLEEIERLRREEITV